MITVTLNPTGPKERELSVKVADDIATIFRELYGPDAKVYVEKENISAAKMSEIQKDNADVLVVSRNLP